MGIGTKALLLSTGLASLGLAGYNLFGPAYANYMDLKRALKLKQDAENTVKPAIGAALGGLALGGLGSYAAAKLFTSPGSDRLSDAATPGDRIRTIGGILTGRTGMEGSAGYRNMIAERSADRAAIARANRTLPDYAKYSSLRRAPWDKTAGTLKGFLTGAGVIGALAGAYGLSDYGARLLARQHMINANKINEAESWRRLAVPGAALGGLLLGGTVGALAGNNSALRQARELENDVYGATSDKYTAAELRRKEAAYTQAHKALAAQYMGD